MCVYTVINSQSSLYIEELSVFQEEKEVLIVPFAVFRITKIEGVNNNNNENNKSNLVTIYLEECDSNLL
jgi:hypothetical protein